MLISKEQTSIIETYNMRSLIKVKVVGFMEAGFEWREGRKRRFFSDIKEGFIISKWAMASDVYSKEYLQSGKLFDMKYVVTDDNKVYYRPYVKLYFHGGIEALHTFDKYEDAVKFGKDCVFDGGFEVKLVEIDGVIVNNT